jgi:hypothetical protein
MGDLSIIEVTPSSYMQCCSHLCRTTLSKSESDTEFMVVSQSPRDRTPGSVVDSLSHVVGVEQCAVCRCRCENCHQGLFLEDFENKLDCAQIPYRLGIHRRRSFIRRLLAVPRTGIQNLPFRLTTPQRRLVAQERLPTNRMIYFTSEGLFEACRDQSASDLSHQFKSKRPRLELVSSII